LDSRSSNGNPCQSLFLLGGNNPVSEVAVNTAVWGDVRIDFYRHSDSRLTLNVEMHLKIIWLI
jgi:hypothetical protein